jgi:hypothetical protein
MYVLLYVLACYSSSPLLSLPLHWRSHPHEIESISDVSVCDLISGHPEAVWGRSDQFSLGLIHVPKVR